jgi:nitroreductase
MEHKQIYPRFTSLTRRDFLRFLPVAGGALLLNGCAGNLASIPSPTFSPTKSFTLPPTLPIQSDATQTASLTSQPSETYTLTPEPPTETLPPVDGSYSTYPLPTPQIPNNMPLMQALQERHSTRTFRADELSVSAIAAILWAGFGVNRPDGKRTAPSAYNVQDIDIYLATGKGLFRYEAAGHSLAALLPDDLRPFTGTQGFVATAPLNLVYVSDYNRIGASAEDCLQWSWAHSGCIAQNVYLACAALGLAAVVRSTFDRVALSERMGLGENQHITLAQTIGYPA